MMKSICLELGGACSTTGSNVSAEIIEQANVLFYKEIHGSRCATETDRQHAAVHFLNLHGVIAALYIGLEAANDIDAYTYIFQINKTLTHDSS